MCKNLLWEKKYFWFKQRIACDLVIKTLLILSLLHSGHSLSCCLLAEQLLSEAEAGPKEAET